MGNEANKSKRKAANANNGDENTANAAPTKRQRVSRACDQCRTAREKCDGIDPCFACASQNRHCSYNSNPKKRGIQPGYIRTLELSLAWVFDKIPGSEEALNNLLNHESGQGQSLLVGKDTPESQKLHRRWRRSPIHKEIDRLLSRGEVVAQASEKVSPRDEESESEDEPVKTEPNRTTSGPVATLTPSSLNSEAVMDTLGLYRNRQPAAAPEGTPSRTRQLELEPVPEPRLILPPNRWHLFDIYFAYTHCWFPIIEKHDILKTSYAYPEDGIWVPADASGSAAHAELWAVLAVASLQDYGSNKANGKDQETKIHPHDIYRTARKFIPTEQGNFELGHVKALLLLSLVNIGRKSLTTAWMLIGYAVRIALELGLESDRGHDLGHSRKKHVFLGCFVLDTIIASQLGRIPHLKAEHIESINLLNEDGLEEWQPWSGCVGFGSNECRQSRSPVHSLSTFNQIVKIHRIFNRTHSPQKDRRLSIQQMAQDDAVTSLRQSINSQSSTAPFVLTGQGPDSAVPPAFLLRLLYLTSVTTLRVSPAETTASSILDLTEQFTSVFGLCGVPPIFSSCLSIARQRIPPEALSQDLATRWHKAETLLCSTWNCSNITTALDTSGPTLPLTANTRLPPVPTNNFATHPTPLLEPILSPTYSTRPLPLPLGQSAPPYLGPNAAQPSTASATQQQSQSQPHQSAQPGPHSGAPPPNQHTRMALDYYDALLDDFATSLDGTDRVEADPQFMQNLGFAPGSDLNDVLGADFAGYGGWGGMAPG